MTTQRIQLDISSDIFDKVMFFLENLPKNKVKIAFLNNTEKEDETDYLLSNPANASHLLQAINNIE